MSYRCAQLSTIGVSDFPIILNFVSVQWYSNTRSVLKNYTIELLRVVIGNHLTLNIEYTNTVNNN